jgi:hypothetical protein
VFAKLREMLSVSKHAARIFICRDLILRILTMRNLGTISGQILKRVCSLGINRAWENVRDNINVSVKEVRYGKLKQHWFDEQYS